MIRNFPRPRAILRNNPGGWDYVPSDATWYGAGAMVVQEGADCWTVYPYREVSDPLPVAWGIFASPIDARMAWDAANAKRVRRLNNTPSVLP